MTEQIETNFNDCCVVIPARLAASRLPGKPLADIAGAPMIVHVVQRALEAAIGPVIVACDDSGVADAVSPLGVEAILTEPGLASGSDRVEAALNAVDPDGRYRIVVNLQGDLPTIEPAVIRKVARSLDDPAVDIGTVAAPFTDAEQRDNPNVVKAAVEAGPGESGGRALYFSRTPIPAGEGPLYHHIGIYAFRREALRRFVQAPPGHLERRERLEQLRALGMGMRLDVAFVDVVPIGVDTPADLEAVRAILAARRDPAGESRRDGAGGRPASQEKE